MNNHNMPLRPEAGPIPILPSGPLIQCQHDALEMIIKALLKAKDLAVMQAYRDSGDKIDTNRVNRMFFVSGEPGSGKSSLYLTLQHIMDNSDDDFQRLKSSDSDEKYKEIITDLKLLRNSIRWLEPIDLEVAGDEGENLLAAVLVRISDALGEQSSSAQACRKAMADLDQLANDIGIAWDGNLQARASSLDPTSYSQEVMSAQRARLHINNRLGKALNIFSKKECFGCTKETLFVLPIDDFYLKPAVSLNLLRLLRMISVPRLFFLIMGDLKTMEALFLEKSLADWTKVASPEVFAALEERKKQEILSRAREMSSRYLRKLLPASQRAFLDRTQLLEALDYKPIFHDSTNKSLVDLPTLSCLLSKVNLTENQPEGVTDLGSFLVPAQFREFKRDFNTKKHKLDIGYSAAQVLEAMPREVMDLWMYFDESTNDKNPDDNMTCAPSYLDKILEIIFLTIDEQDFLEQSQQELLRNSFPTGLDVGVGSVKTEWINFQAEVSARIPIDDESVFIRKHWSWRIHVVDEGKKHHEPQPFSYLPPRQTAWIILLHDLLWYWEPEKITQNLVEKLIQSLKKPVSRLDQQTLGWAWHKPQWLWVHFPFPKGLSTFRQLDRLLEFWNYFMPEWDSTKSVKGMFERWSFAGWLAMGPENRYDAVLKHISEHSGPEACSYENLLEKLTNGEKSCYDKFMRTLSKEDGFKSLVK